MKSSYAVAAAVACLLAGSPLHAEPKNPPSKSPSAPVVHYFHLADFLSDLNGDALLKEYRVGTRVESAELDVCYAVPDAWPRHDRVILKFLEGNRLRARAQSQNEKAEVLVDLQRTVSGNRHSLRGTVTLDGQEWEVSSGNNTQLTASEYEDAQSSGFRIEEQPDDFTELSPQMVAVTVARASAPDLIKGLREQKVRIGLASLEPNCSVVRTGNQFVYMEVDPEAAPALMAKLKTMPGVSAVGYTDGGVSIERAIRFAAAGWLDNSRKLNRTKFSAAVSAAVAKNFSAEFVAASWNEATGVLSIVVKRPDQTMPELGLIEVVTVEVLVGPEKPGSTANLVAWVGTVAADVVDESSGPKLTLKTATSDESERVPNDSDSAIEAIAATLKGKVWDSDNGRWSR